MLYDYKHNYWNHIIFKPASKYAYQPHTKIIIVMVIASPLQEPKELSKDHSAHLVVSFTWPHIVIYLISSYNPHNSNIMQCDRILPTSEKTTSNPLLPKQIMVRAFRCFALGA